ncbi:aminotransferase class I/II-fold pyridoxal phosphate-dependent enzyme [Nocardioides sp. L-11A]|uniref:aminotransferase class I/II-fold pyridoxal phosphate-dependent enzyme n=1 Tax=Nocardioides sp. L-11A TaxID=3043848 RepID=UPI002499B49B|nr:aminotransferase class I/II-fold pyridoxal phosphate-dependent enzyme [Nocardioides sp. L-11A]
MPKQRDLGGRPSAPITGATAGEIAASVRDHVDSGVLAPGAPLPPVRQLAEVLGVNRNTVVAAYRQLVQAGVAQTHGRAGTTVAEPQESAEEGFARDTVLRDVGHGNPAADLLPDLSAGLAAASRPPTLYGEPVIDPELAEWATRWIAVDHPRDFRLTLTHGAVDAVERLLAQALTQGDAVALEDPCFLASIHTVRLAGYRTVPVPIDEEGMTVLGLRAALRAGVRAVVCTPRAHNPTGASLSAARAADLRAVLAEHPYVLVIEDDHYSRLATTGYHSIIGPEHARWALVRSVSKFLGPDLRLAFVASDPETARRLATRISPGTTWVSHLLQRLARTLLLDPAAGRQVAAAAAHYAERNTAFVAALAGHGIAARAGDGLNVWVDVQGDAARVGRRLMRRGWLARTGGDFALGTAGSAARHLRLTVHDLDADAADRLVADVAEAVAGRPTTGPTA